MQNKLTLFSFPLLTIIEATIVWIVSGIQGQIETPSATADDFSDSIKVLCVDVREKGVP